MKTFLTVEKPATVVANQETFLIPKGTSVELVCVNSTYKGAMIRVRTPQGAIGDLEPRFFNQTQVQPLLREAYSRR